MASELIRRAAPDDLAGILRLMRQEMGWPDDERAEQLWRWKHEQNPFGASHVWVGVVDGRIVGVRAFLPWRLRDASGGVIHGVRAVDTATDREHRGRGWFRRLTLHGLAELEGEGVTLVFNTPNEQSRPGYLSMGWVDQERPAVWIRPSGVAGVGKLFRARTSADLWPHENSVGRDPQDAFELPEVIAMANAPRPCRLGHVLTDSSVEFLRWRYGLPALGYRVLPAADGFATGLVVIRTRRRGRSIERAVLATLGRKDAWTSAVAARDSCDFAVAMGTRPGFGWWKVPRFGPRLVSRPIGSGSIPSHFDLVLGDVELL